MGSEHEWLDAELAPQSEDSADVRWALETAIAMWLRGDRNQALSWIRNAVQSASTEGRHDRAYALGTVASKLEKRPLPTERPRQAQMPVSTTQPTAGETSPLNEAVKVHRPRKSLMQTAPYRIPPDEVTHLIEPDSALLEACQPEATAAQMEIDGAPTRAGIPAEATSPLIVSPAEPAPRAERPRPPTVVRDALDATLTDVRPQPPVSRDVAEHTVVMTAEELMPPSHGEATRNPSTLGSRQAVLEPMRALRVAVHSGSGREIVVHLLSDGETAPEGAQEALLLPLAAKPSGS